MICGLDKNIYELISSKVYEYVKDYVIAALAVNVTDSYVEVQNYWKDSMDNFGIDNIHQVLDFLKLDETKVIYQSTCTQIPDLFIDLHGDIIECLEKVYNKPLIKDFTLKPECIDTIKINIINLLMMEAAALHSDLDELKIIKDRLNILIPKLSQTIASHEKYNADDLNKLIIKFLDAWGNLINRYHVAVNKYLDEMYPRQVEGVYSEVMNSIISNVFDALNKLLENGEDLTKAYTMLNEYFKYLLE